jgi:hypothetical protein
MRPLPLLVAAATAATAATALVDPEDWFGDAAVLVSVAVLAAAFVAFSWWDLWATRHNR